MMFINIRRYNLYLSILTGVFLSCTNTHNSPMQNVGIKNADSVNVERCNPDTLLGLLDPTVIHPEEQDSLNEWKEIDSGLGVYYKDIMLTMPIVDIINPQLKLYLSDYIIPMVKRKGFDRYENFITVNYRNNKSISTDNLSAKIAILVDYCGMTYDKAHEIYDGKYKVAFIDDIPVMFEDFKIKGFIKDTSKIYGYRRWQKDFILLMSCELETEFYFSVIDGNIYYTGYEDWGLYLVKSESDMPEVWKPEQAEQTDSLTSDSILRESNSTEIEQNIDETDTIVSPAI